MIAPPPDRRPRFGGVYAHRSGKPPDEAKMYRLAIIGRVLIRSKSCTISKVVRRTAMRGNINQALRASNWHCISHGPWRQRVGDSPGASPHEVDSGLARTRKPHSGTPRRWEDRQLSRTGSWMPKGNQKPQRRRNALAVLLE
jgi:hypothetical protein